MPSSRRSPSPEVAALRAVAEGSCKQLRDQAGEQAKLIRSAAVGELTEAAAARQADAELRKAWRARHEKAAGRRWRR